MAFHYNKNKQSHSSGDSFWTSYSDLFLGLSTIFLMLYVTSSLRTGTDAIQSQVENQKLGMQVDELKNQLKMYESVKADYMDKQASKDEVQEYQELLDKLTLLEDNAKDDKERLAREALENDQKAKALNKYQQMVRNIMNANKVAKSRIVTRNGIIQEQDTEIGQQEQDIKNLQTDINSKKQLIAQGEQKIATQQAVLNDKVKELKHAYQANHITKKAFEQKTKLLRAESEQKIRALENVKGTYESQIAQASQKMSQLASSLEQTQGALTQKEAEAQGLQTQLGKADAEAKGLKNELGRVGQEAEGLRNQLGKADAEARGLKGQMASLEAGYAAQKARDKAAFDAALGKEKMGAAERGRREAQFRADADRKEKEMQGKLAGLQGQLQGTEAALSKAREEIDARRDVAKEIQKNFAAAGIKADVDMGTGEVVLDFGDAYFDSDSAALKPRMTEVLEKAMPLYSRSLFENAKVAGKISAVEVIGFASPTYKGKFVNPMSSDPDDKAALKYNMDLSYRRANAIFSHLIDEKNPDFHHQKELLALMKVSGRSFLEVMKVPARNVANAAEFCKYNDCKKAQRVIVRFSMDGKK